MAQMYWIIPVEGGGRPDNSLPGGPSQPIYHPGHPDHGLPPFPSQGLPGGSGGRLDPDQGLPPFPQPRDFRLAATDIPRMNCRCRNRRPESLETTSIVAVTAGPVEGVGGESLRARIFSPIRACRAPKPKIAAAASRKA